ncbi:MAG: RNA 3'-terminal phosphate cyclase [Halobacteriota archaeon]
MIEIDGSIGEGGGEVLRICLALSALTQTPVTITNIRLNRKNPGLRSQHFTAIRALAKVTAAKVGGLAMGSSKLVFSPGPIRGGTFHFDVKTAGSTTLVLQALLPVLAFADQRSSVTLIGGTNNPLAPQADYVINVLNPVLVNMGFKYRFCLIKRGFYPRGGGLINVLTEPVNELHPVDIVNMGTVQGIRGISHSSNLPKHVVKRQANAAKCSCSRAGFQTTGFVCDAGLETKSPSIGSGVVLWAETSTGGKLAGDSLGAPGKPAERVGEQAAAKLLLQLSSGAPIDTHLSDQLIVWLALAKGRSRIKTTMLTLHAVTAIKVTEKLTGSQFKIRGKVGESGIIQCTPGVA